MEMIDIALEKKMISIFEIVNTAEDRMAHLDTS
jgi:hypothetical protein